MIRTDKSKPRTIDNGQTLLCSYCDTYKPCAEFPERTKEQYGRAYYCLPCYRMRYPLQDHKRIITDTHAECRTCGKDKPLDSFSTNTSKGKSYLQSSCNECRSLKFKRSYIPATKNPYPKTAFSNYIGKASKRGYSFSLTVEQFWNIKRQPCTYCGQKPHPTKGNGIDRVNNSIGYEPDNCVPCCSTCNIMKHVLTLEDFIARVKLIASRFIHPELKKPPEAIL